MKVALIADVHANLPALQAVLEHARKQGAGALWNVGDVLGYGPFPEEVVRRLRCENGVGILGNYDLKALATGGKRHHRKKQKTKQFAFAWAYRELSKASLTYLQSLPREMRLDVEGKRILLTHGSPASNKESITTETPEARLRELAAMAGTDMVIGGHSHRPCLRRVAGVWFVNPGSVGRPDDGDPRASYALLEFRRGAIHVELFRLRYEVARAVEAIHQRRLPEVFARMLEQGRALNDLTKAEPEAGPGAAPPDDRNMLREAGRLLQSCDVETKHSAQVTWLALRLFDELRVLHGLNVRERLWLHCGALLHDIGWIKGRKGHHKSALYIILETRKLSWDQHRRLMVGAIARYHRKARPGPAHDHFMALTPGDRKTVTVLSALVRLADGLDCTHRNVVEELTCKVKDRKIVVICRTRRSMEEERQSALEKGDLFQHVFHRRLAIKCRPIKKE